MSNVSFSDSDSSSLSSAPLTEEEEEEEEESIEDESPMQVDDEEEPPTEGITKYFHKKSESPAPKRSPSPPHEYVLADNPDIAVWVILQLFQ